MKPKLTKPDIYSNCCLECGFPSLTAHYDGCSKTTKPEESVKESGWEEEFDNKVKEMPKKLIELVEWNKIKDFIRQLYQQALAEGKRIGREEVVEEMKRDIKKPFNKKEFVRLANEVGKLAGVDVSNLKIKK